MPISQSPYVFITRTTISQAEIAQVLDKGQKLMSDLAIDAGYADLYHTKESSSISMRLQLYLALYAIQSWDVSTNAMNFFDQPHLVKLMSMVEQLFYIVQIQKAC